MEKSEKVQCEATLIISSAEYSTDQLVSAVAEQPNRVVERGPYQSKTGKAHNHPESKIFFNSPINQAEHVESHIKALLEVVPRYKGRLSNSLPKCTFEIWCTITSERESGFVGITLDNGLIKSAAHFDTGIVLSVWQH